ncbi:MAG: hypothetical protein GXP55_04590 [Deltaproteobacteria bacterium]|nr:hypothetical protein [Deltaproteobacteria bacterium]
MALESSEEQLRDSAAPTPLEAHAPRRVKTVFGLMSWSLVVLVALVELVGHFTIQSRVPTDADWATAGQFVRTNLEPRDTIVAAPGWADPLLRRELGDVISLDMAGMSDLAPFDRLWALSIRGHLPEVAPARAPDFEQRFGRVRVLRWDLGPSRVLYNFVDHVSEARVDFDEGGRTRSCRKTHGRSSPGGLSAGPSVPHDRFVCDPQRPWLWVGATVVEDLSLAPRHCVYEHPIGPTPFRVTFPNVPLGERLVLYAGLYSEHERMQVWPDIRLRVLADGREIAAMNHKDGEGWKRLEALTTAGRASELTVEVTSAVQHYRTFCWSATTRLGVEERTP